MNLTYWLVRSTDHFSSELLSSDCHHRGARSDIKPAVLQEAPNLQIHERRKKKIYLDSLKNISR